MYGGIIPELSGSGKSQCFGGESWHSEGYRIKHSGGDRVNETFRQWQSQNPTKPKVLEASTQQN